MATSSITLPNAQGPQTQRSEREDTAPKRKVTPSQLCAFNDWIRNKVSSENSKYYHQRAIDLAHPDDRARLAVGREQSFYDHEEIFKKSVYAEIAADEHPHLEKRLRSRRYEVRRAAAEEMWDHIFRQDETKAQMKGLIGRRGFTQEHFDHAIKFLKSDLTPAEKSELVHAYLHASAKVSIVIPPQLPQKFSEASTLDKWTSEEVEVTAIPEQKEEVILIAPPTAGVPTSSLSTEEKGVGFGQVPKELMDKTVALVKTLAALPPVPGVNDSNYADAVGEMRMAWQGNGDVIDLMVKNGLRQDRADLLKEWLATDVPVSDGKPEYGPLYVSLMTDFGSTLKSLARDMGLQVDAPPKEQTTVTPAEETKAGTEPSDELLAAITQGVVNSLPPQITGREEDGAIKFDMEAAKIAHMSWNVNEYIARPMIYYLKKNYKLDNSQLTALKDYLGANSEDIEDNDLIAFGALNTLRDGVLELAKRKGLQLPPAQKGGGAPPVAVTVPEVEAAPSPPPAPTRAAAPIPQLASVTLPPLTAEGGKAILNEDELRRELLSILNEVYGGENLEDTLAEKHTELTENMVERKKLKTDFLQNEGALNENELSFTKRRHLDKDLKPLSKRETEILGEIDGLQARLEPVKSGRFDFAKAHVYGELHKEQATVDSELQKVSKAIAKLEKGISTLNEKAEKLKADPEKATRYNEVVITVSEKEKDRAEKIKQRRLLEGRRLNLIKQRTHLGEMDQRMQSGVFDAKPVIDENTTTVFDNALKTQEAARAAIIEGEIQAARTSGSGTEIERINTLQDQAKKEREDLQKQLDALRSAVRETDELSRDNVNRMQERLHSHIQLTSEQFEALEQVKPLLPQPSPARTDAEMKPPEAPYIGPLAGMAIPALRGETAPIAGIPAQPGATVTQDDIDALYDEIKKVGREGKEERARLEEKLNKLSAEERETRKALLRKRAEEDKLDWFVNELRSAATAPLSGEAIPSTPATQPAETAQPKPIVLYTTTGQFSTPELDKMEKDLEELAKAPLPGPAPQPSTQPAIAPATEAATSAAETMPFTLPTEKEAKPAELPQPPISQPDEKEIMETLSRAGTTLTLAESNASRMAELLKPGRGLSRNEEEELVTVMRELDANRTAVTDDLNKIRQNPRMRTDPAIPDLDERLSQLRQTVLKTEIPPNVANRLVAEQAKSIRPAAAPEKRFGEVNLDNVWHPGDVLIGSDGKVPAVAYDVGLVPNLAKASFLVSAIELVSSTAVERALGAADLERLEGLKKELKTRLANDAYAGYGIDPAKLKFLKIPPQEVEAALTTTAGMETVKRAIANYLFVFLRIPTPHGESRGYEALEAIKSHPLITLLKREREMMAEEAAGATAVAEVAASQAEAPRPEPAARRERATIPASMPKDLSDEEEWERHMDVQNLAFVSDLTTLYTDRRGWPELSQKDSGKIIAWRTQNKNAKGTIPFKPAMYGPLGNYRKAWERVIGNVRKGVVYVQATEHVLPAMFVSPAMLEAWKQFFGAPTVRESAREMSGRLGSSFGSDHMKTIELFVVSKRDIENAGRLPDAVNRYLSAIFALGTDAQKKTIADFINMRLSGIASSEAAAAAKTLRTEEPATAWEETNETMGNWYDAGAARRAQMLAVDATLYRRFLKAYPETAGMPVSEFRKSIGALGVGVRDHMLSELEKHDQKTRMAKLSSMGIPRALAESRAEYFGIETARYADLVLAYPQLAAYPTGGAQDEGHIQSEKDYINSMLKQMERKGKLLPPPHPPESQRAGRFMRWLRRKTSQESKDRQIKSLLDTFAGPLLDAEAKIIEGRKPAIRGSAAEKLARRIHLRVGEEGRKAAVMREMGKLAEEEPATAKGMQHGEYIETEEDSAPSNNVGFVSAGEVKKAAELPKTEREKSAVESKMKTAKPPAKPESRGDEEEDGMIASSSEEE